MSPTLGATGSDTLSMEDQLGTMAYAATILQVTGCASMLCGPGTCVVAPEGPLCDCEGTGMEGPHCTDLLPPLTSASLSPSPSPSATFITLAPGILKACPGRVGPLLGSVCSGRGECVRSQPGCSEDSSDCIAVCRCDYCFCNTCTCTHPFDRHDRPNRRFIRDKYPPPGYLAPSRIQ